MSDVSVRVVKACMELARLSGMDPAPLIDDLASPAELSDGRYRMPWASFVALLRRMRDGVGSLDGLEEVGANVVKVERDFSAFTPLFESPMEFMRFSLAGWVPAGMSTLHCTLDVKDERHGRYDVRYSPVHEDSPELQRLQVGLVRALPEAFGLPHAKVTPKFAPHRATYDFVLAAPKKSAKARPRAGPSPQASQALIGAFTEFAFAARRLSELAVSRRLEEQRYDAMTQLGHALVTTTDRQQRALLWAEMLAAFPGCERAEVHGADGIVATSGDAAPKGEATVRELKVGDRRVGEVRAWISDRHEQFSVTLDRVRPWAALGIAAGVELSGFEPSKEGDGFSPRFSRAARVWELTDRQQQVLALLVRGKSNKEIAAQLQCAERTVEIHVTHLLRKSAAASRAMITAKFWTEL